MALSKATFTLFFSPADGLIKVKAGETVMTQFKATRRKGRRLCLGGLLLQQSVLK